MLRINIVLHTLVRPKLSRGEEAEAYPDDDQGDELHPVQRLVIEEHSDEQVQRWADVLGHAEGEHLDLLGRTGEQRQRDHRHQPAEQEEPVLIRLALAEGTAASELKEEDDHQGDGCQEKGLAHQRDGRWFGDAFFDRGVHGKSGRDEQRDRRRLAVVDQHDDHGGQGE